MYVVLHCVGVELGVVKVGKEHRVMTIRDTHFTVHVLYRRHLGGRGHLTWGV